MFRAKKYLSDAEIQKIVDFWDESEVEDGGSDDEEFPENNELVIDSARLEKNFEEEEILDIENMPIDILEDSITEALCLPNADLNAKAEAELKAMKAATAKLYGKKKSF